MPRANRRAVFFDRDGTIIYDAGYLRTPEQVQPLPGMAESLLELSHSGFRLVLVSNQSGVGRGVLSADDLELVHCRVKALLAEHAVHLDGVYYCHHAPWEGCECRKLSAAMILRAARELDIGLNRSFMVGDKSSDVEAGVRAGCHTILLVPPGGFRDPPDQVPDYVATGWPEVTRYILRHIGELL